MLGQPRDTSAIRRAVLVFGSQVAMARALDVNKSTICEWVLGSRPIPAERCPQIERMTRERGRPILCEELRPDVEWSTLRRAPADVGAA